MTKDRNKTRCSVDSLSKELKSASQRIRDLEQALAERKQQDAQQKNTLRTIAQSEAFLEESAEIAHLGYAIWDDTLDRDLSVSNELARIHGFTPDEYLELVNSMGKYLEFIVPEDRKKYLDYENQSVSYFAGEPAGIEYRIMRADGEIRHLIQRSQYVPVPSGRPTQSIVVIQDVTELKQAELLLKKSREALEESEAMLTQSAAMANLGHAIWDYVDDRYITVSEGWANIFGYTKEEFRSTIKTVENDSELIHPADRERYHAYYENPEEEPEIEYRIVRRDGKTRYVLQHYEYVSKESGEPTKALVTIQDITDRIEHENELIQTQEKLRAAQQQAEAANEAKSLFLATMSHEIRSPLHVILTMNTLLQESELTA